MKNQFLRWAVDSSATFLRSRVQIPSLLTINAPFRIFSWDFTQKSLPFSKIKIQAFVVNHMGEVVAYLVEWSLLIPEVFGLNPVIIKIYIEHYWTYWTGHFLKKHLGLVWLSCCNLLSLRLPMSKFLQCPLVCLRLCQGSTILKAYLGTWPS